MLLSHKNDIVDFFTTLFAYSIETTILKHLPYRGSLWRQLIPMKLNQVPNFLFNNEPYTCISSDFVKPGKGAAFYKIKVQNLLTGNVLDKTLRSGEKVDAADVLETDMEFLYFDGSDYVFMDQKTFDQHQVADTAVGDTKDFLLENLSCIITLWNNQAIAVRLPNTVNVKVVYTEPAIKGDTQSRVLKDAEIETGATVQVPTFIDTNEVITIDTRTREYTGRVTG